MRVFEGRDVEHVVAPCGHVQVQTACVEVVSITIETGRAHQIFKVHGPITTILRRQANVTLALIRRVVDHHEPAVASRARPDPRDETVRRPVAFPRGRTFEQPPVTVANGRMVEHGEQAVVEPLQRAVGWFERRADEVRRNRFLRPSN